MSSTDDEVSKLQGQIEDKNKELGEANDRSKDLQKDLDKLRDQITGTSLTLEEYRSEQRSKAEEQARVSSTIAELTREIQTLEAEMRSKQAAQ